MRWRAVSFVKLVLLPQNRMAFDPHNRTTFHSNRRDSPCHSFNIHLWERFYGSLRMMRVPKGGTNHPGWRKQIYWLSKLLWHKIRDHSLKFIPFCHSAPQIDENEEKSLSTDCEHSSPDQLPSVRECDRGKNQRSCLHRLFALSRHDTSYYSLLYFSILSIHLFLNENGCERRSDAFARNWGREEALNYS